MTKEQLKKAADDLREFADNLEKNNPAECTHSAIYHHTDIMGPGGAYVVDSRYMGVTWIFTTYPRPVDSDKLRAVIEGRL